MSSPKGDNHPVDQVSGLLGPEESYLYKYDPSD